MKVTKTSCGLGKSCESTSGVNIYTLDFHQMATRVRYISCIGASDICYSVM